MERVSLKQGSNMKNKNVIKHNPDAVNEVVKLLSNKWKIFIIRDLLDGKRRFGELKKMTGATQKSLTSALRELENDEIIERKAYAEIPPRVEYSLTDIGYSLAPVIDTMADWGTDFIKYKELKEKIKNKK